MNNFVVIFINLSCAVSAYWILHRFKFSFMKLGSSTHTWAALFLASIFFTIGLLLFDIPFGFFGMNNPQTTQWLQTYWWFMPSTIFMFFLISFSLKLIVDCLRGRSKNKEVWRQLLPGSGLLAASLLAFLVLVGFADQEAEPPTAADAPFLLLFWLLGTVMVYLITLGLGALLQSNRRHSRS